MLTLDKIYQASHVLRSVIRKTDLIQAPKLCPDCNLFLKTENLQVTGSFKVRGAYYMMSQLTEEEKHGVSSPALPATTHRVWLWLRQRTT